MANRDLGACYACPPTAKQPARDLHHVLPVEYDGAMDGKQVPLCKACHDTVHTLARAAIAGETVPPNHNPVQQMLAKYIVQQHAVFRANGGVAADARNMVQFSCTAEEKAIAHDLKRALGFRSLERMFKHLMIAEWQRRRGRT